MADLGDFDAEQTPTMREREPIPPGEYTAQILSSEMKPTQNGGQCLNLEWVLTDEGPYQNRRVWSRLNLVNKTPLAVQIAKEELSSICHAVGKLRIGDSVELHDLPCIIKIKIRPAKGDYAASNEIAAYKPLNGADPGSPPAAAMAATPAPPTPRPVAAAPQQPAATKNVPPFFRTRQPA